jgi:hypothetical protein
MDKEWEERNEKLIEEYDETVSSIDWFLIVFVTIIIISGILILGAAITNP